MKQAFYIESNRFSPEYQAQVENLHSQSMIDVHEEGRYMVYSLEIADPHALTFDQSWILGSTKERMIEQGLLPLVHVEYDVVLSKSGKHIRSSMDVRTAGDPTVECVYRLMNVYKDVGGISLGETTAWVEHV